LILPAIDQEIFAFAEFSEAAPAKKSLLGIYSLLHNAGASFSPLPMG